MHNLVANPAFPYVFPFVLCIVLVMLRDIHPMAVYVLYPVQTVAVGASLIWLHKRLPSLLPSRWFLSLLAGIAGVVLWVGLDHLIRNSAPDFAAISWIADKPWLLDTLNHLFLKHEPGTGFNPWILESAALCWFVVIFRVIGPVLVIPFVEEIFWRGFLMRYLIKEDFESVRLGTYSHFSFWFTTLMFAGIHGWQWPLGIAVGVVWGALFVWSKNLGNLIVAHAVTNLLLAVWVLKSGEYWFW